MTFGVDVVVVVGLALRQFLRPERHVEVVIEVVAVRRRPPDLPAHALAERLQLRQRRAGDRDVADVVMFQMHQGAADLVDLERAPDAALGPVGSEHEVLDDELAASVEQVGERPRAVRRVEHVGLVQPDPGQRAALGVEFVAHPGEGLFPGQELLAGREPLIARYDLVVHG